MSERQHTASRANSVPQPTTSRTGTNRDQEVVVSLVCPFHPPLLPRVARPNRAGRVVKPYHHFTPDPKSPERNGHNLVFPVWSSDMFITACFD